MNLFVTEANVIETILNNSELFYFVNVFITVIFTLTWLFHNLSHIVFPHLIPSSLMRKIHTRLSTTVVRGRL